MSTEQLLMRGFPVPSAGTYVLLEDIVDALRAYAQAQEAPEAGAAIHEAASWLSSGEGLTEPRYVTDEEPEVYGAEEGDDSPDVARVEVFPDPPDDPRPKWYARSVDTGGHILKTTGGSFDFEWVVQNAQERWPEIEVHLLKNAGEDSKWTEDSTRGVFPSMGPPMRRLWSR